MGGCESQVATVADSQRPVPERWIRSAKGLLPIRHHEAFVARSELTGGKPRRTLMR
jgi:hypothetical protein